MLSLRAVRRCGSFAGEQRLSAAPPVRHFQLELEAAGTEMPRWMLFALFLPAVANAVRSIDSHSNPRVGATSAKGCQHTVENC